MSAIVLDPVSIQRFQQRPMNFTRRTIQRPTNNRTQKNRATNYAALKAAYAPKIVIAEKEESTIREFPPPKLDIFAEGNEAPMATSVFNLSPDDVRCSASALKIQKSEKLAQDYLRFYGSKFLTSVDPDSLKSCFGLLIHFAHAPPMAMDATTSIQETMFKPLCQIVDASNEPIFILHTKGVKRVTPNELQTIYYELFDY
jgi:hypothetical protein